MRAGEVDEYSQSLARLHAAGVRFVVIGVGGVNYYARGGHTLFATQDRDLFLPADPENLLRCWNVLSDSGWELWSGVEPLDLPRDLWLAEQVVVRKAAVKATHGEGLEIDLTLVMKGFSFDEVWSGRRIFQSGDFEFPVASLEHIVESKRAVGRPKDLLFFATHEEILEQLFRARREDHE